MATASNTPPPYTDDEIREAHAFFGLTSSVEIYLTLIPAARAEIERQHREAVWVKTIFADYAARLKDTPYRVPHPLPVPVGLDGHPMRPPQPTFKGRPNGGADPEPDFLFHHPV